MVEESERCGPERVLEGLAESKHYFAMKLHVLLLLLMVVFFIITVILLCALLLFISLGLSLFIRLLLALFGCLSLDFIREESRLLAHQPAVHILRLLEKVVVEASAL